MRSPPEYDAFLFWLCCVLRILIASFYNTQRTQCLCTTHQCMCACAHNPHCTLPHPFPHPPALHPWLRVQLEWNTHVCVTTMTSDAPIKSQKQLGIATLKKLRLRKRNNAYELPEQTDWLSTPWVTTQPPSKPWSKDSLKQLKTLITMWGVANRLLPRTTWVFSTPFTVTLSLRSSYRNCYEYSLLSLQCL